MGSRRSAALLVLLIIGGCDRQPAAAPSPPATAEKPQPAPSIEPASFDESALFGGKFHPASDGSGDYLITDSGVWLLRGSEAVKVKEVEKLSTPKPTTWPTRGHFNIDLGGVTVSGD